MTVHIRQANLIEDERVLKDLVQGYLNSDADERRFRWLYCESPFGPAQAWIAYEKNDEPVGMAALFPRQMYCHGTVVNGCVLGDLCIATKYRSLGPALQLQRACLSCARSGEFSLAYDFPSITMLGIYQHLGVQPVARLIRMVKVLRVDKKMRSIFPTPLFSRPAAIAANFALSFTDATSPDLPGLDFHMEDAPCTSEYTELAARIGSSMGMCTVRSAEYLNWRFRQHPRLEYEFLAARRGNDLLAYCTFTTVDGNATVAELFGSMDNRVLPSLLQRLVSLLRGRGVATVSLPILSNDGRAGWLRRMGFWAREAVPVMVLASETPTSGSQVLLMHGDRES